MDLQGTARADAPDAPIFIDNAGLVLLTPFIPHLFARLGVVAPDGRGDHGGQSIADPSRAVRLLSYLVDGRTDRPDPMLALPRLMCGLTPDPALDPPGAGGIAPDVADLDLCESLLRAVIANWHVLANTTPDGLRETFLQRAGQLRRIADRWELSVPRAPFDVLIDRIPWSFSAIRHGWMPEPLFVSW